MSKRKTDETMTEARIARGKRTREVQTAEPQAEVQIEVPPDVAGEAPAKRRKARPPAIVSEEKPDTDADLVVFAFRLKATERDLIHKAAGAAKASRFVRTLTIAASKGDERAVVDIVRAVKSEMASAS